MLAQQQRINQSLMSEGIEPNDLKQIPPIILGLGFLMVRLD